MIIIDWMMMMMVVCVCFSAGVTAFGKFPQKRLR